LAYLVVDPEALTAAASDLTDIGSALNGANAAAAGQTTELLAAGTDDVSVAVASLFAGHALDYQTLSAQMNVFHQQFSQLLTSGAASYAATESASANPL
jgi:hypothetical protein